MESEQRTTAAVQGFLGKLEGADPADPVIRDLLGRSAERLRLLCSTLLFGSYPRLTRPPLNLQPDEMLGAVVERLLKAMREVRPQNVRQFFGLANRHMRWELNDMARRLDQQSSVVGLQDSAIPAPESSGSVVSVNTSRMLEAIERLPEEEREVFDLLRIQGMSYTEVAQLLSVSESTVHRRLNRGLVSLEEQLADLRPPGRATS
ncbi:MAG: sigma-70 family RNA polymerase sigma factor [Phycisphaerae bacterium]|jgi:RNA polymerase sigma factor (sigma-70 family)|nr:sigma-70 family RNA polymerase sigma factor [Phycisphaerae bacterium]